MGEAQLVGRGVGGHKAYGVDIHGQAIGIFAHNIQRFRAVGPINAHGVGRGDAVGLQKQEQVAHAAVFRPGGADALQALFAHPADGKQTFRGRIQHGDGFRAEGRHNASGQLRAHALDQAGGQIEADALAGGGQHFFRRAELQLPAEARIIDPAAAYLQLHARLRRDHMPHAGHGIPVAFARALRRRGRKAQHRKAVLLVLEDHALHRAGQFPRRRIAQQGQVVVGQSTW
jgi:hypothetical protein